MLTFTEAALDGGRVDFGGGNLPLVPPRPLPDIRSVETATKTDVPRCKTSVVVRTETRAHRLACDRLRTSHR